MEQLAQRILAMDSADLEGRIDAMWDLYSTGGMEEDELFDPSLEDLRELGPSLLDHKELPYPQSLVDAPDFDPEKVIKKLIHIGEDPELIDLIVDGWNDTPEPAVALEEHVASLRALAARKDPQTRQLFKWLFCGQHRSALRHLHENGAPPGFSELHVIELIARQSLIWCAHDLQMVAASQGLALRTPVPELLDPAKGYIRGSKVMTLFKTMKADRDKNLDLYMDREARNADRRRRIAERKPGCPVAPAEVPKATGMGRRARRAAESKLAKLSAREAVEERRRLDWEHSKIKMIRAGDEGPFIEALKNPSAVHAREFRKMFASIRYSGLTPLTCIAVASARLVQAELYFAAALSKFRENIVLRNPLPVSQLFVRRDLDGVSVPGSLPPFHRKEIENASKSRRVRAIMDNYRRLFLEDASFRNKSSDKSAQLDPSDRQGQKEMVAAFCFLEKCGQTRLMDHVGDADCPRRTFYLLDVKPEFRLTR